MSYFYRKRRSHPEPKLAGRTARALKRRAGGGAPAAERRVS